MFKQEIVNLGKQMHTAFIGGVVLIVAGDAMVLVGINHQVELLAVGDQGLDELHGILVVDIVVTAAMAEQIITLNEFRVVYG